MTDSTSLPTLLLIDGHSLAFRSFYAFTKGGTIKGLQTSQGVPTNICFGFLKSLLQVMKTLQPQRLAIAFDRSEPTFRHEAYAQYKAKRREVPEDFVPDLANLHKLLSALNLPMVTKAGYEADDILGTLSQQGTREGYQVKILTGDQDLLQLVDDQRQISVLLFDRGATRKAKESWTEYQEAEIIEKLKVKSQQVIDYKSLCGDSSDNIPGVSGIGPVTAAKLLNQYPTLEDIYDNIAQIKGAARKKLEAGREDAQQAKFLVTIQQDVPLELPVKNLQLPGFDPNLVKPFLEELELNQFIQQIDQLHEQLGGEIKEENTPLNPTKTEGEDTWFFSYEDTLNTASQETATITITPQIITTEAQLKTLVKTLQTCTSQDTPVAWDTETTTLNPRTATLVGIGCCWGENAEELAYIPMGHTQGEQLPQETVLTALRPIIESETYPKVLQNSKFDRLVLRYQGINLAGVVLDTLLASYVLNPDESHNLTDLSLRYLTNIEAKSYKDLDIPKGKTIADLSIEKTAIYCGWDVYATFSLVAPLQEKLAQFPQLKTLLKEIEQPLEPVLAEMEYQGIRVDLEYLSNLSQQLGETLQHIENNAYDAAGEEFNLNSPKQLSALLFEKLGLKPKRKTKTGYSTDHSTLEQLQGDHPVIDHILDHRTLSKLKSTYVDALPSLVNPETARIHGDFNQAVTSTGRLSSSNPNLQNIPIRSEFSRQIRKAFVPREDWVLVSADYSQIELRILAHFSQEQVLVEAYNNYEDVHTVTAQLLFEKEKEEVTAEERRLGKTINFGVIYGMGAQRFAREAGVSASEGKLFIDRYRERYAAVFAYLEAQKREAIARGYVETLYHRRRYFQFESETLRTLQGCSPDEIQLDSLKRLSKEDAQLLRGAANAPIQGSSADIIKIAMVKLYEILQDYQAKLLLQVHDELVLEVPPQELTDLREKIRTTMENAVELSVPLVVEVRTGENWMEVK
ncbi:DNA polymerase I [Spirulina sp. CS-785/01]|uniref:DNA polymerase I n=1 Tax=Spirulina sp. CS-785/01 TaxID=3021716 RepID=UPI0023305F3E|nr:DNA polymerase I [Spirulina sp. CS-785/01]MDB9315434.1 DNA polymerase I [Spirulina sp. CS-785/01]